jgi:hypothetical protein
MERESMKLKFKMVAIATALASLAGGAQADLTSGPVVNNGSFSMLAFNTVTRDWYIRDLGLFINDFIPTGITTSVGDGSVAGTRTPEAGIIVAGSVAAAAAAFPGDSRPVQVESNFSDPAFATWFGAQTATDVRWMVGAYDQLSSAATTSQRRAIISSKNPNEDFFNANLDTFVSTGSYGGLFSLFNPGTLSRTGVSLSGQADTGLSAGLNLNTLGTVGDSQSLFYVVRTAFTGSSSNPANVTAFGNANGLATITLLANGDLNYAVSAVPLPPALWLMGAGLVAMGGMVRRRRAAAALQA